MTTPDPRKLSWRCPAGDVAGIAARVAESTWTCSTCGRIDASVQIAAGYAYVQRQSCPCERDARSQERARVAAEGVTAQRDVARTVHAIGGMEPEMRSW